MLRSYTRAINNQQGRSGALFREETKAECVNCSDGVSPAFFTTQLNIGLPEKQYPQVCFNYIHLNPVKAGLVRQAEEWEFYSAKDYYGMRADKLVNKSVAEKYVKW